MSVIKRFDFDVIRTQPHQLSGEVKDIVLSNFNTSSQFIKIKKGDDYIDLPTGNIILNKFEYLEIEYQETKQNANDTDELLSFDYHVIDFEGNVSNTAVVNITGKCTKIQPIEKYHFENLIVNNSCITSINPESRFDINKIIINNHNYESMIQFQKVVISRLQHDGKTEILKLYDGNSILNESVNSFEISMEELIKGLIIRPKSIDSSYNNSTTFKFQFFDKKGDFSNIATATYTYDCVIQNPLPTSSDVYVQAEYFDFKTHLIPNDSDPIKYIVFKEVIGVNLQENTKIEWNTFNEYTWQNFTAEFAFIDEPNKEISLDSSKLNWYKIQFEIPNPIINHITKIINIMDAYNGVGPIEVLPDCFINVKVNDTSCLQGDITISLENLTSGQTEEYTFGVTEIFTTQVLRNSNYIIRITNYNPVNCNTVDTIIDLSPMETHFSSANCACDINFIFNYGMYGFDSSAINLHFEDNKIKMEGNFTSIDGFPDLLTPYYIGKVEHCDCIKLGSEEIQNIGFTVKDYSFMIDRDSNLIYIRNTSDAPEKYFSGNGIFFEGECS